MLKQEEEKEKPDGWQFSIGSKMSDVAMQYNPTCVLIFLGNWEKIQVKSLKLHMLSIICLSMQLNSEEKFTDLFDRLDYNLYYSSPKGESVLLTFIQGNFTGITKYAIVNSWGFWQWHILDLFT